MLRRYQTITCVFAVGGALGLLSTTDYQKLGPSSVASPNPLPTHCEHHSRRYYGSNALGATKVLCGRRESGADSPSSGGHTRRASKKRSARRRGRDETHAAASLSDEIIRDYWLHQVRTNAGRHCSNVVMAGNVDARTAASALASAADKGQHTSAAQHQSNHPSGGARHDDYSRSRRS